MPFCLQWALPYIRRYRNFGQRTNSPVETAHNAIKSFLVSGTGHLLTLSQAIEQMLDNKERSYRERASKGAHRLKHDYNGRRWLGRLPSEITAIAVELIIGQHSLVEAAKLPRNAPLGCCSEECTFTQQFALPCCHQIAKADEEGRPLTKEIVHPRWWLEVPLVSNSVVLLRKSTNLRLIGH